MKRSERREIRKRYPVRYEIPAEWAPVGLMILAWLAFLTGLIFGRWHFALAALCGGVAVGATLLALVVWGLTLWIRSVETR